MDERRHQHPVRVSGLQKCSFLGCAKPQSDSGLIPCVQCFGATLYCSEECRVKDFLNHTLQCQRTVRKVATGESRIAARRIQQINMSKGSGLPRLLGDMQQQISAVDKEENMFFLPMPFDTSVKTNARSDIKKMKRSEVAMRMAGTAAYGWYEQHAADRQGDLFMYVFVYPPDMSFIFVVALPCDKTKYDNFEHAFIPCGCALHSSKAPAA